MFSLSTLVNDLKDLVSRFDSDVRTVFIYGPSTQNWFDEEFLPQIQAF